MRNILIAAILLFSFPAIAGPVKIIEMKNGFLLETRYRQEIVIPTIDEINQLLTKPSKASVLCLALNIYREARGSTQEDMWAIGHVTMNHLMVSRDDRTLCETVFNIKYKGATKHYRGIPVGLFSWTVLKQKMKLDMNDPVWCLTQRIAYNIYVDADAYNPIDDRQHFWNPKKVNPSWAKKAINPIMVGSHMYTNLKDTVVRGPSS